MHAIIIISNIQSCIKYRKKVHTNIIPNIVLCITRKLKRGHPLYLHIYEEVVQNDDLDNMLKKRGIEIDEELAIWRTQLPICIYICAEVLIYIYILNTHIY